jgi:4-oxalocrotonate tautomerase
MPMVQVTMLAGRTADQKRKIAKRITEALVEEAGAWREGIIVAFHEVSKESYASGGELMGGHEVVDLPRQLLLARRGKVYPRNIDSVAYPIGSNRWPSTRSPTFGRSLRAICRK